jgi:hypothetical protein
MLGDNWTTIAEFLTIIMVMAIIVFPHEILYRDRMRPGDLVEIMGFTSFITTCLVIVIILFVAYGLIHHDPIAPPPPAVPGVTGEHEAGRGETAIRDLNGIERAAEHGTPSLSAGRPDSPTRQSQGELPDQTAASTGQP